MSDKKAKSVTIKDVLTKSSAQIYDEGSKSQKIAVLVIFSAVMFFLVGPDIYAFLK